MPKEHEIIFEDLHAVPDQQTVTVDLDADDKDKGITRFSEDDDEGKVVDLDDDGDEEAKKKREEAARKKAEGDDDDDDDARYSKKVKSRIDRAARKAREEAQRADYWEKQARETKKQLAEQRKKDAKTIIDRSDKELEEAEAALEKAHEDGDTKAVVRLTSRLTDIKAAKIQAKYDLDQPDDDTFTDAGNYSADRDKVPESERKRARFVADWKDENDDWYGRGGFERQTRVANRIDKEVFDDGFDPGTEEYYQELTTRIKEKLPDLFADDTGKDGKVGTTRSRSKGKSPVAPVRGAESAATRKSSSSRVELDANDFQNMRRYGLDTNDPEVLKEYARNKREAEQQSALRQ